jgi:Mycothiol maleylpyruvate isomerase N-terminal domain
VTGAAAVVDALLAQWERIERAVPSLDLDRPCRLASWTNRELLAHLALQPVLVERFLSTASDEAPEFTVAQNLAGTQSLAEVIDAAARDGARENRIEFGAAVQRVRDDLLHADGERSIRSMQGWIRLTDYLVTRCVEAVVHGLDFVPAVMPDPGAEQIVAEALYTALDARAPELGAPARALAPRRWIDMATGRVPASAALDAVLPLMR